MIKEGAFFFKALYLKGSFCDTIWLTLDRIQLRGKMENKADSCKVAKEVDSSENCIAIAFEEQSDENILRDDAISCIRCIVWPWNIDRG